MSQPDDIVELLGALTESDRRWIVERLPSAARAQLAKRIAAAPESTSQPPATEKRAAPADTDDLEQCAARVSAATPSAMSRVLREEPTWLIRAVLQLRDWPWRNVFLQSLPATKKVYVTHALGDEPALGRAAQSWLLHELATRLLALPAESGPDMRFATLLARATRKVIRQ
jgi:hypothetical protein